jgi:hypothetical protein
MILCPFLLGFALGCRSLQIGGSWSTHGLSWVFLSRLRLSLLRSCLCLFDAIVGLHAMDEKMFNDFLIEN